MTRASRAALWSALSSPAVFQQLLGTRPLARTDHFVLHHSASALPMPSGTELSTGPVTSQVEAVDDTPGSAPRRLGLIVPKRHARRAVTRSLIRRQARVLLAHSDLPGGDWLLRLRLEFDRRQFPSAASEALKGTVRAELGGLIAAAGRRLAGARTP